MRFASELDLKNFPIHYDNERLGPWELTALNRVQCQALLEKLVDPKLAELRAWSKALDEMTATLKAELATFKGKRPHPTFDRPGEIRTSLRQIHDGVCHDGTEEGVCWTDEQMLRPLCSKPGVNIVPGKPGQADTAKMIASLEADRDYLTAFIGLWPDDQATQPHRYLIDREEWIDDDTCIRKGDIVPLTERRSRSMLNIYALVDVPEVIETYALALNRAQGGR